jgi:transcriptional regulator GlxA family with amidase domain
MPDFTVLVLPGAYATSVAATLDMLHAAAALAPRLQLARPVWRVVSPDGGAVALSGGLSVKTTRMPACRSSDRSIWTVPGLGVDSAADVARRLSGSAAERAASRLRDHAEQGGCVAASCSAVFLLQAAGLLRGRRVTTSWWLATELCRVQPDCLVDAGRMVVSDGPVMTAGAAFGQSDLMLNLICQRFSPALADAVGRVLLIDERQAQSRYAVPTMLANGHELIRRLTRYIEDALPQPPSVGALAAAFAMSPRTLSRHVRAVTGQPPLALVQTVRLNRARALIENSRMSVDRVAAEVGYGNATALRRLMRQLAGANPSVFRRAASLR